MVLPLQLILPFIIRSSRRKFLIAVQEHDEYINKLAKRSICPICLFTTLYVALLFQNEQIISVFANGVGFMVVLGSFSIIIIRCMYLNKMLVVEQHKLLTMAKGELLKAFK